MKAKIFLLVAITSLLTNCRKEFSFENQPPVAIAGLDQQVILPAMVLLDGSQSYDPGGGPLSFYWQQIDGPSQVVFSHSDSSHTHLSNLAAGVFQFELKVKDVAGLEDRDTLQLTAIQGSGSNLPPIAVAGSDQQLPQGTLATILNGSASTDPDGTIVSFLWQQLSGPSQSTIALAGQAITNVSNFTSGSYAYQLTVTDNEGAFSRDTISIFVGTTGSNLPPVAVAGPDQFLASGVSTASLNGSSSFDPDGTIISYAWIQISGPSTSIISAPSQPITSLSNFFTGLYAYQLTVTDNSGASGKDTVHVQVSSSCTDSRISLQAQLLPFGTLSQARSRLSAASVNNKILFAGGGANLNYSTRVDIYDISNATWSQSELSIGRQGMAIASGNGKIYFAGGANYDSGYVFSRVDIFHANTNSWTIDELSEARGDGAAAIINNKLLVAGGAFWQPTYDGSSRVDILDLTTNNWTIKNLSVPRFGLSANQAGNKILFAGGIISCCYASSTSPAIDVYDPSTGNFSALPDGLSPPRAWMASIATGNKVIWGGGFALMQANPPHSLTDVVEIRDVVTNTKEFTCLSQPNGWFNAVQKNDEIVFFTKDVMGAPLFQHFDIYNLTTKTWKVGQLPFQLNGAAIVSVNNEVYVAGGILNGTATNMVWKLVW